MTIQEKTTKPFILVDGSSYLHRAYHAIPDLTNSKGQPTGAIYGVINMLKRLIEDYHPEHIAVVFDAKGKNFRHELYPAYKSNRPPMADDLKVQIEPLHKIIKAMGIPLLTFEGIEADDVIGTLTHHITQLKYPVLISTSDKDIAQLVNPQVTLVDTMSNTVLDEKGVEKKFGITPAQITDYLTLVGDTSDNIPGIPGVGPKTAVKWLKLYGSLDNIAAHADDITGKVGENLRAFLPQLPLSKELVTLRCDLELPVDPLSLWDRQDDIAKLAELFTAFEFKGWFRELATQNPTSRTTTHQTQYQAIVDQTQFNHWVEKLKTADLIAFDTETTSLNPMDARIVGLSFAITPFEAIYIPLRHDDLEQPQLDREEVLKALKPLLENPDLKKVGHNLKYDKAVLANENIDLQGIAYDTMLESYVLNSTERHSLNALALKYLSLQKIEYESLTGKGAKQISFAQVPIQQATPYAAEDADATLQLHELWKPHFEANKKLRYVLEHIEMPLLSVLSRMERAGVLIDVERLTQHSQELEHALSDLEAQIFTQAGTTFNIDSPKQLQEILYDKLKLPPSKKTPTGQLSTAESVLEELALVYPVPRLVLEYRTLNKLKSTYTDRLPAQVHPQTGRIHTSYHQAVTTTGRLSSTDPNLQNIPIRTAEGRRIRQAFIAPPGYKIVAADYSQIELRLAAHFSCDRTLIEDFKKGLDIHKATAAKLFGVSLEEVDKAQRRKAKMINFGLLYGMSTFGFAERLGVDRVTAKAYIDAYFTKYPTIKTYMEKAREQAHKQGYVETLFGRRVYTPEIFSKNKQRQNAAERAAINGPLQGTAADIIKFAMITIDDWLQTSSMQVKLIMQVHDELVFEIAEEDLTLALPKIEQLMCNAAVLVVPLTIDIGIGENWDEAH